MLRKLIVLFFCFSLVFQPELLAQAYGMWRTTEYEYDAAGRQTAVIDPNGDVTEYEYTGSRRILARDSLGRETRFVYDNLGRLTRTIYPDDTFTTISYDTLGRRTTQTNQAGHTRRFEYDPAGRLTAVILPAVADPCNGDILTYPRYECQYDVYGNLIKRKDYVKQFELRSAADFNPATDIDRTGARETTFTYDELNQQLTKELPLGQIETREYDSNGLLTKITDFNNHVTTFDYDSQGRLRYKRYFLNESESANPTNADPNIYYQYDALGRKTHETMSDYGTIAYHYDQEGRIYQVDSPEGFIRYEFSDITGRRVAVRTPADNADTRIAYIYDELGRLSGVTVDKRNDVDVTETTSYTYDAAGSVETITYPNGNYAACTYDSLNRLTKLEHKNSSNTLLAGYTYTLAADGMRESVTEANSAGNIATYTWVYDGMNRLTSEVYDDLVGSDDYEDTYVYNLVGNRLQKQVEGQPGTTYSYNDNYQLTSQITDGNSITYTYSANGSLTYVAKDNDANLTYVYDYRNRIVQASIENGATVDYEYNPGGVRVNADIQGGTATDYLLDPFNHTGYTQVFKEIGNSNTIYVIGHDVLAQATGTNNPKYFLYDGHGSVRHLADENGALVSGQTFAYDAYGHRTDVSTAQTNLLYTGEWWDSYIGGYNLRTRDYRPDIGIFMTQDTYAGNLEDPISLHKYLYCHNNPINGIDPSGQMTIQEVSVAIGIALLVMAGIHSVAHQAKHHIQEELERISETEAITFLGRGLQEQMSREFLATSDPEVLRFNMEWWHEKAELNKAVTYYNARTQKTLLEFIDTTYHSLQIAGVGLGVTGAVAKTPIFWSRPHPPSNLYHWKTIISNATRVAAKGEAKAVYTNSYLSTLTNGKCAVKMAPDLAVVMPNGKLRIFEVLSPTQSYNQLLKKGWKYKQALGNMLEHYEILDIGGIAP